MRLSLVQSQILKPPFWPSQTPTFQGHSHQQIWRKTQALSSKITLLLKKLSLLLHRTRVTISTSPLLSAFTTLRPVFPSRKLLLILKFARPQTPPIPMKLLLSAKLLALSLTSPIATCSKPLESVSALDMLQLPSLYSFPLSKFSLPLQPPS